MSRFAGAHWLLPGLMVGGLLLGLLLALAHHLFYQSLNGHIVGSDEQQQWNVRIGTGLSFVVKTCFTAAAGIAYTQLLWHQLKSHPVTIDGADALFGVISNAWDFRHLEVYKHGLLLPVIALIAW